MSNKKIFNIEDLASALAFYGNTSPREFVLIHHAIYNNVALSDAQIDLILEFARKIAEVNVVRYKDASKRDENGLQLPIKARVTLEPVAPDILTVREEFKDYLAEILQLGFSSKDEEVIKSLTHIASCWLRMAYPYSIENGVMAELICVTYLSDGEV